MKKSFRDAYNRELALLYERSAEFAAEYPGIAERLGGLLRENADPAVAGLLEGTAFLAARVQLKQQEEFRGFTTELLEQIFPDALAPIPSAILIHAQVPAERVDPAKGLDFAPGAYLDARFVDADQRVSCRFRLAAPLQLWPIEADGCAYLSGKGAVGALGRDPADDTRAALTIDLRRIGGARGAGIADVAADVIPVHLSGELAHAVPLYEQIHCDRTRAYLRWTDAAGDPVFAPLDPRQIEQIGFDADERLFPDDRRLFDGFAQLREAFVFPRKYLGFRLRGLQPLLRRAHGDRVQIVFEFASANDVLAARVGPSHVRLHCAPAINLFEESSNQVRLDQKRHEYVVTPDSSPVTHYEIQRITEVFAHYPGRVAKVPVLPLYALPTGTVPSRQALYYTTRRRQRRLTEAERRFGMRHRYRGTETFISIYEPPEADGAERAQRLQIKALCSNRHLPEYLPIAGSDDFHFTDDTSVGLSVIAGPTAPRESMTEIDRRASHRATQGDIYWRLISYLSLNHFGLDDRGGRDAAASLRELLALFADLSDVVTEAQIAGITALSTRPVVRSIRRADGFFPARGLEIAITFNDAAFEGSGMILLAAVLDRFLAEYAAVNSFTQTVTISEQRGEVMRWPPRTGTGPLL